MPYDICTTHRFSGLWASYYQNYQNNYQNNQFSEYLPQPGAKYLSSYLETKLVPLQNSLVIFITAIPPISQYHHMLWLVLNQLQFN